MHDILYTDNRPLKRGIMDEIASCKFVENCGSIVFQGYTMSGYEFDPRDKDGSLRDRFDCYCKVICRAAHNLAYKEAQYLIRHYSGGEINPAVLLHEDDTNVVLPIISKISPKIIIHLCR